MIEYPTLKIMRDQVARQIGDSTDDRAQKIDEWLNIHYAEICRKHPWSQLMRSSEEEIDLNAGTIYVYLPKEVEQLYFVLAQNEAAAIQMAIEAAIKGAGSAYRTVGEVYAWSEAGEFGRRMDFLAAGEKLLLSTTGAAAVAAVVHGTVTSRSPNNDSQEIREEVTISPSTGVTTVNAFKDLYSVGIGVVDSGARISVMGSTSGDIYATIGEGENTARYKRVRLMQPDVIGSFVTLIWKKRPFKLISDNQAIEIPVGTQVVEACIATMMVNQREYNGAAIYHQGRSRDGVDQVFNSSEEQNSKLVLGQPLPRYRSKRIIIKN